MAGRVVRADDRHRALDERRPEELEREAGRLAAALAVAETEYEAYYAEAVELRGLVAGGAAEIGRLTTALELATARYRAAEVMLIERVADLERALAEAVGTWTPLAQCDSEREGDALTAFEARARALLAGEA